MLSLSQNLFCLFSRPFIIIHVFWLLFESALAKLLNNTTLLVIMENKKHIFTPLERKTFVEISKQYSRIIENKDTDSATLQSKNLAWDKIMTEFNTSPNATVQVCKLQ